ncbi:MAG: hypothetical protein HQ521_22060, partial [Bacteroidetes bacterium]|nr:hypothetical protein [Bacteroidota bacterium]
FMDAVRANRPNVTDEQLEGGIFQVENVVGSLIDSIGDLDFAIARAAELGNEKKKQDSNNNSNSNNMSKVNLSILAVAAGLETLEVSEGGVFLTQEQAEAVQTVLTNNKTTIDAYSGLKDGETVDGLRTEITDLTKTNGELTTKNTGLTTENETLSKGTVKETGAIAETDESSSQTSADAQAEHFFNLSKIK